MDGNSGRKRRVEVDSSPWWSRLDCCGPGGQFGHSYPGRHGFLCHPADRPSPRLVAVLRRDGDGRRSRWRLSHLSACKKRWQGEHREKDRKEEGHESLQEV